jgi:putative ABC transport system permease protein
MKQWFGNIRLDLRYSFRILGRQKGVSLVSVTALALAIGLSATLFSFFNNYLLKGLPFEGGKHIYHLWVQEVDDNDPDFTPLFVSHFVQEAKIEGMELAHYEELTVNFRGMGLPYRVSGFRVSANFFNLLGVLPGMGTSFIPGDDSPGGRRVVVLSHAFWQSEFGGARDVIGRSVEVDGATMRIIGVLEEGFRFARRNDIFLPQQLDPLDPDDGEDEVITVARLSPDIPVQRVGTELTSLLDRFNRDFPHWDDPLSRLFLEPYHLAALEAEGVRRVQLLQIFGVLVLFMGSVNVSILTLAQFFQRSREFAVRGSLGAQGSRLIQQLLIESLVLTGIGTLLGIGLAWIGIRWLWSVTREFAPIWVDPFSLDAGVLLYAAAISLFAAFVAGLIPALKVRFLHPGLALREDDRVGAGFRLGFLNRAIVAFQVGLAFALLIGASLILRTLQEMEGLETGLQMDNRYMARMSTRDPRYYDQAQAYHYFESLRRELLGHPDITAVAVSEESPLDGTSDDDIYFRQGPYVYPNEGLEVFSLSVSDGYFETLGIPLLRGREFEKTDTLSSQPVAIVNESFARENFDTLDCLGEQFREEEEGDPWLTIVGVVPDLWMGGVFDFDDDSPGYYRPTSQDIDNAMSIIARSRIPLQDWQQIIAEAAFKVNPNETPKDVESISSRYADMLAVPRVLARLFSVFGLASTGMALVGIYSLFSFSVNQRIREFGIRMALGAHSRGILLQVILQNIFRMIPGFGLGLLLSVFLVRMLLEAELIEAVSPVDPLAYLVTVALLVLVGVAATWIPARRASKVDPAIALREY